MSFSFKRWVMAMVGAFGVIAASDFVIHNLWLGEFYRRTAQWWRAPEEMQAMLGLMFVSEVLLAGLLAVIYTKGYEAGKAGIGQGFRFGVLMGLLLAVPAGRGLPCDHGHPVRRAPSGARSWVAGPRTRAPGARV